MRVAIYGAGSLGTVLGAYVSKNAAQKGVDLGDGIELYNRNRAHTAALKERGAHITGEVDFTQPVRAFYPGEMEGEFDIILLLTKQLDNAKVASFLKPHLKADGVLCTMQNGLPEPLLASVLGKERVLGCTIAWGATMGEPGTSRLTSSPDALTFALGAPYPEAECHLDDVKRVLELMGPVVVEENFLGARWSKLLINTAFSGMSAVTGLTFGGVCDNRIARHCVQEIVKECIDVCKAASIKMTPVQGKDIAKLFDYKGPFKKRFSFMLIPVAMRRHRGIRSGMLGDLERKKPCEIDAIVGCVCREGTGVGVKTPFCDLVCRIVHGFESGEGKPDAANLSQFGALLS